MTKEIKILAFSGALRQDSMNQKLVVYASSLISSPQVSIEVINLNDFAMPLYDGDIESKTGLPETAKTLKKKMIGMDGFLIASPEYNGSISGVLKNTIDWVSRSEHGEEGLLAFKGKIVGLLSASPGMLGGLRGLVHVRQILGNIGCLVLPEQHCVGQAIKAFNKQGELIDQMNIDKVRIVTQALIHVTQKLTST